MIPTEPDDARHDWRIRAARASDAPFLERLAARLAIGIPPWRDEGAMAITARSWLLHDLARVGPDAAVLLAETGDGIPMGAVAVARSQHFTGSPQAEIGELAVVAEWEGRGVAAALLDAAEAWARAAGLPFVSLATGAANVRALAFYARHGYQQEDIRLTKPLNG
jgi:ribosomal protein S18 acetylase RimI-like enzyme